MATKRLARSIIEVGRGKHGKYARKQIARAQRRRRLDDEGELLDGKRIYEGRELRDNLNPLRNWLLRHVGKSWARTYSEFCAKVPRGSIQGDHIHMHARDMVKGAGGRELFVYPSPFHRPCMKEHGYNRFWLDVRGILRHHTEQECRRAADKVGWKPPKVAPIPPYVPKPTAKDHIKEQATKALIERNALLHRTLALA